ncbi:MAG: hypothetical protein HKP55_11910 [Gammaproteobacteria bacterium]|nr:hypothetical protein [Gammaproteobacteria bacterium]
MNEHHSIKNSLKISLLFLRIGVFIVFFMWTLDKFINPGHASAVFSKFYFYDGLSVSLAYGIGAIQFLIIFFFLLGIKKQLSYGLVFCMHLISTLTSYEKYFDPWTYPNLLFFAAWPMLAAIVALYLLREEDTLLTIKRNITS